MDQQSAIPNLGMRVLQGVILGIVLSIPVILWALSRAAAFQEPVGDHDGVAVADAPVAGRGAAKSSNPSNSTTARKRIPAPAAARRDEYVTVPPSQMHLRIDNGSRPASSAAQQSIEANEE